MGSALALPEEAAVVQREMAAAEGSAGALSGAMAVAVARVVGVALRMRQMEAVGAVAMLQLLAALVEVPCMLTTGQQWSLRVKSPKCMRFVQQ